MCLPPDENRRFDTIVGKNKRNTLRAVRALRVVSNANNPSGAAKIKSDPFGSFFISITILPLHIFLWYIIIYLSKQRFLTMAMIFCTECGKKMSSQAITCPHCGCPNKTLGKSINGLYKGKKSIVVYLLLCWFLGIIGAHRYYAGKYGTAILMTVLTITFVGIFITCIWALVDLIVGFCCLGTPEKIFTE